VYSPCPASFAQQRLWLLEQMAPGSRYNIQVALRIKGGLDLQFLNNAWQELVKRHEILRTTFAWVDEQVMQIVPPELNCPLILTDLTRNNLAQAETQANHILAKQAQGKFDLANGPLARPAALKLGAEDHILSLTMHHIIVDGWSLMVLVRELTELYAAFHEGRAHRLAPLTIQYADFAWWQRQQMSGNLLEQQLSYWKKQLGSAPVPQLPVDHPRSEKEGFQGSYCKFQVSEELAEGLRALGRRSHASLFMILLSAWKVLLYRHTGQEDIVVGAPIANRTRVEVESLIGFFVNTLVLRTDLSGNPSFIELLSRVRRTTLDAYEHQDMPYEKLVAELQPKRTTGQNLFFATLLNWLNTPVSKLEFAGMQSGFVHSLPVDNPTVKFDLSLNVIEMSGGLPASLEYSTDLFEEATISRMAEHVQNLLTAVAANPQRPLSEFPLLKEEECRQILVEWNHTTREYPARETVLELLEGQAQKMPELPAVVFEGQCLSYRELHQQANQLARFLQKLGVAPEVPACVCMERSARLVVAVLAIMKAGGAYAPLDPSSPAERLNYMVNDSQPAIVLVDRDGGEKLLDAKTRLLFLEEEQETISKESGSALESKVNGDNVVYLIYTSGSTGRPKGVMNIHRGLLNRMQWMQETYPLDVTDRLLQKTPIGFDVSVWEFLWPLMYGGCLVVARPEGHRDSQYLIQTIQQERITLLHFVPSMLAAFLQEPEVERCSSLHRVFSSGEALPALVAANFHQLLQADLHNLYGPTEASIEVSCWTCSRQQQEQNIPIGRPIANTQLYVLDAHMQPVANGATGELCIAGEGLARGYWRKAQLTAERFIPNPFSSLSGERLYRTGDLARWRRDGVLEFLGRADHQVKIRGYRVEPGEIESTLLAHAHVREAVVIIREDDSAGKQIAAFVVPNKHTPPTVKELREHVKSLLPFYMRPHVYILMEQLPLNANGKIDQNALAQRQLPLETSQDVLPRTPTEKKLCQIWASILKQEQVGAEDDFFALGGHSFLAVNLISQMKRHFRRDIGLDKIFQHPTPREMARYLDQNEAEYRRAALVCMNKGSAVTPPLYLLYPVAGNILCYSDLARCLSRQKPFYAIQALPGEESQFSTVEEIASSCLSLIKKRDQNNRYELGGWSFGGLIALEMAQQATATGDPPAALYLFDPPIPEELPSTDVPHEELVTLFVLTLIADFNGGKPIEMEESKTKLDPTNNSLEAQLQKAAELGLLPPGTDPAAQAQSFEIFKRNMRAAKLYQPRRYSGKTLMVVRETDSSHRWHNLVPAETNIIRMAGNHFTLLRGANAAKVAGFIESMPGPHDRRA
jgi:amino acid adenylation domain-containing protein